MWFYVLAFAVILIILFAFLPTKPLDDAVRILSRQAARWSTAAAQDENPMIAVLHANYGAGYLWAINDIVTSCEFEKITGYDYIKFRDAIIAVQDAATKKALDVCPDFGPEKTYLAKIGAE